MGAARSSLAMHLTALDWGIVAVYFAVCLAVGVIFSGRASESTDSYFISGRHLPWWLLGTSMVATTFASDTPLAITEFLRVGGIWKNWYWWSLGMGSMLGVFLFAPLWRRVGVLTDNELIELRYEGRPAAFLRGFKALYFSIGYNLIVMGWVIKGIGKMTAVLLDVPEGPAIGVCLAITMIYTLSSGFWGVVVTDLLQFGVAMAGSLVLAFFAVSHLGGMAALLSKLQSLPGFHPETLHFLPAADLSSIHTPFSEIMIYVCLLWWSSHDADGGGYVIQRMLSAKNERHALLGTLWFYLAHYALRVWPWIIVGLASMALFPDLSTHAFKDKAGYPLVMKAVLRPGYAGLMVAYFFGAFMSTIDTHVNWSTSYLIHDVYRRFIRPSAPEKHYVFVARLAGAAIAVAAAYVAVYWIDSISQAWQFIYLMGSGVGLVLIGRLFWWRVNAYSEIAALASSLTLTIGWLCLGRLMPEADFMGYPLASTPLHVKAVVVVPVSIAVWVSATLLTAPVSMEKLERFYRLARPGGLWGPVTRGEKYGGEILGWDFLAKWLGGLLLIYGALFGLGHLVFLRWKEGSLLLAMAAAAGAWLFTLMEPQREELGP